MKTPNTPTFPIVYFFRGHNSRGDEHVRLGPLGLGPYARRLKDGFESVALVPVDGMLRGTVEEMGERAADFILSDSLFQTTERPIHFFGHSLGGLVSRCLVHKPIFKERVKSVVTMGTPHLGMAAAVTGTETTWAMKVLRKTVNSEDGQDYYKCCRPDSAKVFNQKYLDIPGIFYSSVLGIVDRRRLPLTLRIIDHHYNDEPSDGIVPETSQMWGQVLGKYRLDHLEQIGVCQDLNPVRRFDFQREFRKMSRQLTDYWQSFSA